MSEFVVNGQEISTTDYVLRGFPQTDDVVSAEWMAWEEGSAELARQEHEASLLQGCVSLFCPICGTKSGEMTTQDYRDDVEAERLQSEHVTLCETHTRKWQWVPENRGLSLDEYIAMENGK